MTTAYTSLLGLALPVTGELQGTWGDVVNDSITSLLDTAIAGTTSLTTDADTTLSDTDGASNQSRQSIVLWNPASGTVTRNITAPARSKTYVVINATGGTQSIVLRGVGPTTGVTILAGEKAVVAWNGSDFVKVSTFGGSPSFTNVTVTGTTTLSGLTASTALALNASKEVVSVTNTGSGNNVLATSPTLVTPVLGAATATSVNGLTVSSTTGTLTLANGSTLATSGANSLTLTTTGATNVTFPTSGTLATTAGTVASFSAGTTGFTPSTATTGAVTLAGTLATTNGGTGLTSFTANGVVYASSTSALTTGSALTFNSQTLNVVTPSGMGFQFFETSSGNTNRIQLGTGSGFGYINADAGAGTIALAFQVAGSEQMRLTSTGLGIGTSSPAYKLDVRGLIVGGNGTIVGGISYSTRPEIGAISNHPVGFITNNTTQMLLDTSGNLGIGTSSPATKLDVSGPSAVARIAGTSASVPQLQLSSAGVVAWSLRANNDGGSDFTIYQDSTQRLKIDSSGNLGIGTSLPIAGYGLTIGNDSTGNTTVGLAFSTSAAERGSVSMNATVGELRLTAGYAGYGGFQTFYANGSERMRLDSSGNLGLGVTPSGSNLATIQTQWGILSGNEQINIAQNAYYDSAWKYTSTAAASLYFQDNGAHNWRIAPSGTAGNAISFTQAMTLDASGQLLVGKTSSYRNGKLVVAAANVSQTSSQANLHVTTTDTQAADVGGSIGLGGQVGGDEAPFGYISGRKENSTSGNYAGYLAFATQNAAAATTERARITSGGDLLVGTTSTSATAGEGFKVVFPIAAVPSVRSVGNDATSSYSTYEVYSTAAAAYRFYVNYAGTVFATTTTISAISDQRFKENVQDLDVGLNAIMALKPRKFDWKAGKGKDIKGDRGFIAQEFEQVFPDLIDEWKDPAPEGETPYKSVRQDLIPVLVKAIQELKAEFDAYKASHP
jgi:hypothetical protein